MKMNLFEAKQEAKNFKASMRDVISHYDPNRAEQLKWTAHDDFRFLHYWIRFGLNPDFRRVVDCSFADMAHFYFDMGSYIVDFDFDDPDTDDIWAHPAIVRTAGDRKIVTSL